MCVGPMPDNLNLMSEIQTAEELAGMEFDLSGASACPVSTYFRQYIF